MKNSYYNENDPKAAAWLRELIARGLIARGVVDERAIAEVSAADLSGFSQHHFFAGIGGWSYALRLAGWPDDRPVWTGSCPCQPFSVAGKRKGYCDERHLWPEFKRLIAQRTPSIVFGEQVASKAGREWLAGVRLDLEALGYAVGCADLCAAGVGAPHIRQRLYWVADSDFSGEHGRAPSREQSLRVEHIEAGGVADAGYEQARRTADAREAQSGRAFGNVAGRGPTGGLGDADIARSQGCGERSDEHADQWAAWSPSDAIQCIDGKSRRVESGTFPLAHGIPARMGRLRGYGNAIVPQVAAEFIKSFMSIRGK